VNRFRVAVAGVVMFALGFGLSTGLAFGDPDIVPTRLE
jgi:hypothetical protein